ncbi:MAG TPA: DUF1353 domain-containing protein [Dongiaceae bacterium]
MMKLAAWGPILTRALARVLSLPLAATLAACQPGLATTTSFADDIESVLAADLTYRIGASGVAITVPRGFVTDFASIPQPLWSILSPHGRYSRAAIVHDYLYWSQSCTRDQADNLFMIAMQESGVADSDRTAIYQAVSWAGEDAWDANRAERAQGLPRIIPADRLPIPADLTWPDYRQLLFRQGVRDPQVAPGAAYCRLGDTTVVPGATAAVPATVTNAGPAVSLMMP